MRQNIEARFAQLLKISKNHEGEKMKTLNACMYLCNLLFAHMHPLPSMHMLQHQFYTTYEMKVKLNSMKITGK